VSASDAGEPFREGPTRLVHRAFFGAIGLLPRRVRERLRGKIFDALFTLSPDPWGYQDIGYERRKQERLLATVGQEPGVIVEIGCANGHNLEALARRNPLATVVGIDISQSAVRLAEARVAELPNAHALHSTALEALDRLLPTSVDCVVLSEVVYYMGSAECIAQSLAPLCHFTDEDSRVVMLHGSQDAPQLHKRAAVAMDLVISESVVVPDATRPFHIAVAVSPQARGQDEFSYRLSG
jgi:SAM-dependent methyltransferase